MKRLLIFCMLLVLVSGCIPQLEVPEEKVTDIVERIGGELSEALEKLKGDLGSDEYLMTPESRVTVAGKIVGMKEMAFDYDITFTVNGHEYLVGETNREEIVEGIAITVKKVNFDPEDKDTYAIVNIVEYVPGENEYLMYKEDTVEVDGKTVTLKTFKSDKSVYVKVEDQDDRVPEGESIKLRDLTITNVKTNLRAITSEKYSILKIEG